MSDEYVKTDECIINLTTIKKFGVSMIKKNSNFNKKKHLYSRLHLCDKKHSNRNTVQYYCNLIYLFSISI